MVSKFDDLLREARAMCLQESPDKIRLIIASS